MSLHETNRLLETALALHQQGRLADAAGIYQQILQRAPRHADALHLFGVLLHQGGQDENGLRLVGAAIEVEPKRPEYHSNRGIILKALGRPGEAETSFKAALKLDPDFVDALVNLGGLQAESGNNADALGNLQHAVKLAPGNGNAQMNLGNALRADGQMRLAEAAHQKAVELMPISERAHLNLATTLMDLERLQRAQTSLRKSLLLKPDLAEGLNNLAFLEINLSAFKSAGRWFSRAAALQPEYAAPRSGLAEVAYYALDMDTCLRHSRKAVDLAPNDPQIRARHSMRLLAAGRLGEGWDEREWRLRRTDSVRRIGLPPHWQGEDLKGRRILVCAEEGVGDEILYASLIPDLLDMGASVVLECDARMVDVFKRSFPDVFVHSYARAGDRFKPLQKYDWLPDDPPVDFAIDGGSLPKYLRRDLASYEGQAPYLVPDEDRVQDIRRRLAGLGDGVKVGFAWRSMNTTAYRNIHYTTLDHWPSLLTALDIHVVSMQYGSGWQDEIEAARNKFGARIEVLDDLDLTDDFDAILAVASAVDVVVCPSSTLGWIGGGLGKPTFVFHPLPLFVRFGTDHFPGFPSVRSFSKPVQEPWDEVTREVLGAVRALAD